MIRSHTFSVITLAACAMSPAAAYADHMGVPGDPVGFCMIDVRSIKGSSPSQDNATKEFHAGEFLADLQDQLGSLPFTRYEALSHEIQKVPLHEKGVFRVVGAGEEQNTVFVDVECITNDGARVQIDWNGSKEQSVVSSQMRVVNGQNLVVGTDHDDSASTILSIKVNCRAGDSQ